MINAGSPKIPWFANPEDLSPDSIVHRLAVRSANLLARALRRRRRQPLAVVSADEEGFSVQRQVLPVSAACQRGGVVDQASGSGGEVKSSQPGAGE